MFVAVRAVSQQSFRLNVRRLSRPSSSSHSPTAGPEQLRGGKKHLVLQKNIKRYKRSSCLLPFTWTLTLDYLHDLLSSNRLVFSSRVFCRVRTVCNVNRVHSYSTSYLCFREISVEPLSQKHPHETEDRKERAAAEQLKTTFMLTT